MTSLNRKWSNITPAGASYTGDGKSQNPEEFWNSQINAVSKALSPAECAAKEKHIRNVILGTHVEKGCGTFWSCIHRIQIEGNRFTSWKFCYLMHKLMRDGHQSVLTQSLKYKSKINELGKLWYHLRSDIYGPLIFQYAKLIQIKLTFHQNNRNIPGNLALSDAQIASLGERDVNNWFELAIEMLDYMDEILELQKLVFNTMDMSRAYSLTHGGQCRLQPLIPCILESSLLYDYLIKMLFKLHGALPPDILGGHRQRFNSQFTDLKKFYSNCSNLQYFKYLVQIPNIANTPPNFFVAGEFDSYVTDHAVALDAKSDYSDEITTGTLLDLQDDDGASVSPAPAETYVAIPNDKDQLIASLQSDLEDARQYVTKFRSEGQRAIEQYENKISQLEYELQAAKETADNMNEENQRYKMQAEKLQIEKNQQVATNTALEATQKAAASQEEKFKKMKDLYMKIREEHIEALRKLGDLQKESSTLQQQRDEWISNENTLKESLQNAQNDSEQSKLGLVANQQQILSSLCSACVQTLQDTSEQFDNPAFLAVACPPEYALSRLLPLKNDAHAILKKRTLAFCNDTSSTDAACMIATSIIDACHRYADAILLSSAVGHQATSDKSDQLEKLARNSLQRVTQLYGAISMSIRKPDSDSLSNQFGQVDTDLQLLIDLLSSPLTSNDTTAEQLGQMIEQEMQAMDLAIKAAADKISSIIDKSRTKDTGIRLEVNAAILEACTSLMQAVQELVRRARDLQNEIVSQGRGSGSVHEFYKKNHQWTEGLLSAAKAIAGAAKVLVDSADRVIDGTGKFEELMVASREVAASTAQLVVASKIKADRDSPRLGAVSAASRVVTQCTATVIGNVKSARETLDEQSATIDFSALSMHQAKQAEFDAQVKVLELESELQKQRLRLGEIRKLTYKEGSEEK